MPANVMAKLCFNYDNLQKMNCFRLERYGSCISSWRHTVRSNFYSICCSNVFGIYNWLWFIMRSGNLKLAVTTKQIPFEIEIVWKKRRKVISNEWCKVIGLSHQMHEYLSAASQIHMNVTSTPDRPENRSQRHVLLLI